MPKNLLLILLLLSQPAGATWKPEYADQPFEVQQWYRNAELTKAAQERFPFKKCCAKSDVFRTRFRVNKTSGGDEWDYLIDNQWKRIPPDIVHWGVSAPDGRPTLFIYEGKETCFFLGEGG